MVRPTAPRWLSSVFVHPVALKGHNWRSSPGQSLNNPLKILKPPSPWNAGRASRNTPHARRTWMAARNCLATASPPACPSNGKASSPYRKGPASGSNWWRTWNGNSRTGRVPSRCGRTWTARWWTSNGQAPRISASPRRAVPSGAKLSGESQASSASRRAGHSSSMMLYQSVSRRRPRVTMCIRCRPS